LKTEMAGSSSLAEKRTRFSAAIGNFPAARLSRVISGGMRRPRAS